MKIIRNGVELEQFTLTYDGKLYRVTGSPTIAADKYALVEVKRPETMHGRGDRVRFSHWARLVTSKRRDLIREEAIRKFQKF